VRVRARKRNRDDINVTLYISGKCNRFYAYRDGRGIIDLFGFDIEKQELSIGLLQNLSEVYYQKIDAFDRY